MSIPSLTLIPNILMALLLSTFSHGSVRHHWGWNSWEQQSRFQYENYCGDLAINCVANCPAFRQQCSSSGVASSIVNSTIESAQQDQQQQQQYPTHTPIITGPVQETLPDCARGKAKPYCIVTAEFQRNPDCCPGTRCFPFRHDNGRFASLGYCHSINAE